MLGVPVLFENTFEDGRSKEEKLVKQEKSLLRLGRVCLGDRKRRNILCCITRASCVKERYTYIYTGSHFDGTQESRQYMAYRYFLIKIIEDLKGPCVPS